MAARFFRSLHDHAKTRSFISVALDEDTRKLWSRALEVRDLQEDLMDIYRYNASAHINLTKLMLDEQLLVLLIQSESPMTSLATRITRREIRNRRNLSKAEVSRREEEVSYRHSPKF